MTTPPKYVTDNEGNVIGEVVTVKKHEDGFIVVLDLNEQGAALVVDPNSSYSLQNDDTKWFDEKDLQIETWSDGTHAASSVLAVGVTHVPTGLTQSRNLDDQYPTQGAARDEVIRVLREKVRLHYANQEETPHPKRVEVFMPAEER